MRISDGSSDVCSSDLPGAFERHRFADPAPDVGGDPARDRCFPAHREQFGRGVEARQTLDLPRTIELHVDPPTAAEFEHMAAPAGYTPAEQQNGRASCRGRGCPYVRSLVVAVTLKKKT